MEMVDPWYNSLGLEADRVKAKQQASLRKNMTRDPRTSRPFEENESSGPVHCIAAVSVIISDFPPSHLP